MKRGYLLTALLFTAFIFPLGENNGKADAQGPGGPGGMPPMTGGNGLGTADDPEEQDG